MWPKIRLGLFIALGLFGMTESFISSGNLITGANVAVAPSTAGAVVTERTELFVDTVKVESTSGVSVTVNKPTKSGSNPVFGTGSETYDRDKNYASVIKVGSTFKMWYAGLADDFGSTGDLFVCYATSSDGITWAKGNLGLVTYDGDTNNTIILDAPAFNPSVVYNPDGDADKQYIMSTEKETGGSGTSAFIYKSADGITFTQVQELIKFGTGSYEAKDVVLLDSGIWRAYYHVNPGTRSVGLIESESSDITGTWHDSGGALNGLEAVSGTDQEYGFGVHLHHGNWFGFGGNYNSTSEQIHLDLHFSRDGVTWSEISDQWIPLGSGGSWDDEMVLQGKNLVHHNNDWYYFYSGFAANHAASPPRDSRIGLATIGYERIGSIGTTGNLVTDPIMPAADLHVNTDASGGTLKVELLNANDDSVLDGFSQDDFDTISSDTFDTTAQWGGIGIPINKEVKIKFYLSSATLYSYWVRS
jgi:hypothetical protein